MKDDIRRFIDYLAGLGIDKVGHTTGTFLGHLVGVYRLMEVQGCDKEVCLGGMFHSIYGTELFQGFALPLKLRPEIQALIGERAERLAYLNSALDRASFDRTLDVASGPHRIRDRFTSEEIQISTEDFDDLCRVHLYDWLEQVARSSLGWGYRREAYQRMAQRLGQPAQAAYAQRFADEPTTGSTKEVTP
jgi:hypothetical protein